MDQFEVYGQRYDSFNLPKQVLQAYENDKEKVGLAYSFCISQAKQKNQHIVYKNLINEANSRGVKLTAAADYDPDWLQKKENDFRTEFSRKESELKLHMANNIKPSIQMSYLDLARLCIKAGEHRDFEQYATKAHETQPTHTEANYYYKIVLLQNNRNDELKKILDNEIEQENYRTMASELRTAYLHGRVISGINKLRSKDLYGAFSTLCEIAPEHLPDIGIYTSFYDLARYLAVLGVICCKREEIMGKVFVESAKQLLNHNQVAMKLAESYVSANYDEASKALDRIMSEWNNDPYVGNVAHTIHGLVLDKLIKQYLSTISRVKIQTLCDTFRILPEQCEEILHNLILTNKIPFRIDKLNNILVHQNEEQFSQVKMVKKAIGLIGNYCFEKQFAVLKVSFNAMSGTRQKGKGLVETFME